MGALREFTVGCWRGLTGRSLTSIAIAALIMGSAFTVLISFPNEVLSTGINIVPGKRLSSDHNYAYLSSIEAISVPADRPVLYIAGGSSLRESIESAEALRDTLRNEVAPTYEVADFMTKGQQFWLSGAFLEFAVCHGEARRKGIVILAAHAGRFLKRWDAMAGRLPDPRLTNEASSLRDRARFFGMVTLRALADTLHAVSMNRGDDYQENGRHRFVRGLERLEALEDEEEKRQIEKRKFAKKMAVIDDRAKEYDQEYDTSFAEYSGRLEKMILGLKACADVEVVLHLTPMHPAFLENEVAAPVLLRHERNIMDLADRVGATVFVSYRAAEYTDYDFSDTVHLRNWSKIVEVSQKLAAHLVAVAGGGGND